MAARLETGIDVLDRKLEGGIPPGTVVAYTAPPASQSELLLYELTAARGTLYLSTERSAESVRHVIESTLASVGSPTVRHIEESEALTESNRLIGALPDGANLIVDPMNVLEHSSTHNYRLFLNSLKDQMLESGSVAILHCLRGNEIPENRDMTLHFADAVFDLRVDIGTLEVETTLTIPKFRGIKVPMETIKLNLSERVEIDTSRDIA